MDNLEGIDLPDFPFKKEEAWMILEEELKPLVETKLRQNFSDIPEINLSRLQVDIFERLRKAFDKAWPEKTFSLHLTIPFHLEIQPGQDPAPAIKAAVETCWQNLADTMKKELQEWILKYQARTMAQFVGYEMKLLASDGFEGL